MARKGKKRKEQSEVEIADKVERLSEELYHKERSSLVELEMKGAEQYDKAALTLSGGALALSLTFIDDIAPNPIQCTLWLIGFAWLSLIVSITAVMISFQLSQSASRRQREIWDEAFLADDDQLLKVPNKYSWWTDALNKTSLATFILGIILMSIFALTNLTQRDVKSTDGKTTEAETRSTQQEGKDDRR